MHPTPKNNKDTIKTERMITRHLHDVTLCLYQRDGFEAIIAYDRPVDEAGRGQVMATAY